MYIFIYKMMNIKRIVLKIAGKASSLIIVFYKLPGPDRLRKQFIAGCRYTICNESFLRMDRLRYFFLLFFNRRNDRRFRPGGGL